MTMRYIHDYVYFTDSAFGDRFFDVLTSVKYEGVSGVFSPLLTPIKAVSNAAS